MTRSGRTVLFVSHDAGSIAKLCDRALYLRGGRPEFIGPSDEALERYLGAQPLILRGGGRLDGVVHEGSGGARFVEATVRNADGGRELRRDEPLVIELTVERDPHFRATSLDLTIGITDRVIGQLVTLGTQLTPNDVGQRQSIIRCTLDELPLRAGDYALTFSLERGGDTVDRVPNQVEIHVLPPGGATAEADISVVRVRHSWSVEAAASRRELAAVREA
jgi:hypothetical protein